MQKSKIKINDGVPPHTPIDEKIRNPKSEIRDTPINKILIRTPNWLGDSVMSIPTVVGVKRLFPDSSVCVWTKPGLADLWKFIPEVDGVIDRVPRKHGFQLGILLTNSFGSALKMYISGISLRRGYNVKGRGLLLTQPVKLENGWERMHQMEYFLGIVKGLGEIRSSLDYGVVPKIDIPSRLSDEAKRYLVDFGWDGKKNIICVHATAAYGPAKCWNTEKFSQLIDKLVNLYNAWILIIGNRDEEKDVSDILKRLKNINRVINIAGKTDIKQLAGIMSLCSVFIANDSGPMHLAASIGLPVVAIFGSTSPDKTGPRGNCIVLKKDLACSPCFKRRCPKNLECMDLIKVLDVLDAVKKIIGVEVCEAKPRTLRVALVMKDYDEGRGGAERYLVGLAQRLAKEFGTVDLIVNNVKGNVPEDINIKKVKALRWSSVLAPLSFNWSVQRLLKKNRYDLVYGLTQIYPQDLYRVGGGLEHSWFEIRYKKLWQVLINYILPRNLIRFYIEDRIFRNGNYKKIITNSLLCKYQILHHYRISPEDIVVIYNGVDRDKFNPDVKVLYRESVRSELGIGYDDKVVLFISNNWKRKGLFELIESISLMVERNIWLLIVGRGRKGSFKRLAEKAGIEDRIKFIGQTDEPEKYYGASDIFVLPTHYDPFANVCIEALSCGLPVVTTHLNGASEFIVNGKNGYIVSDSKDIEELARSIQKTFSLDKKDIGKDMLYNTAEKNSKETVDLLKSIFTSKQEEGIRPKLRDSGDILINNGYRNIFEKKGWFSFEDVMQYKGGVLYKENKLRSVVKIDVDGESIFLKRHFRKAEPSWAFREWQNIFRLRSIGIPTMNPVAIGEKEEESFIITKAIESSERLEDFINSAKLEISEKRMLIYELALLTKKMHINYLFHKDYYSGHIFVNPAPMHRGGINKDNDKFKLYLIDLQRLRRHWFFHERWCIKDLASLNFSLAGSWVSNIDKMRFLKYYLGETNLSGYRGFINKILIKTEGIKKHTKKILTRRKALCEK